MRLVTLLLALIALPARADEALYWRVVSDAPRVLILGEHHDNPLHHQLRAELLARFNPAGALVFEMIPPEHEQAANRLREAGNIDGIGAAIDWQGMGWGDWSPYAALVRAARAPIVGAGLPRAQTRAVMIQGPGAVVDPAYLVRFGTADADMLAAMSAEQADAHCGKLPAQHLPAMVQVQIARDMLMAQAALEAIEWGAGTVVIITGNGHARRDRGIAYWLRRADPLLPVLSVGYLEQDSNGQISSFWGDPPPFDQVVLTPAHPRGDPCAAFK